MIREIFEKEFSHGNSSPPCSVFFVLCLLVLRARIISWRVSWFPQCILGRHWTREILEPRGFHNQHRCPVPFSPFMPFLQTYIKARNQSLRVLLWGWELRIFFSLCTVVSSPQTLSPIIWGEGAVHSEFTGGKWTVCSRRSDSGVRYEGREGEKNKEDKRERALTPTPSPLCLFVCFFFCLHLLYAVPTIWTPGTG